MSAEKRFAGGGGFIRISGNPAHPSMWVFRQRRNLSGEKIPDRREDSLNGRRPEVSGWGLFRTLEITA